MPVITIAVAILMLALGSLNQMGSTLGTDWLRTRLGSGATLRLAAIPTWKLLAGQIDGGVVAVPEVQWQGLTVRDIVLRSGPCRMAGPCDWNVEMSLPTAVLAANARTALQEFVGQAAESLGLAGADLAEVTITFGSPVVLTGELRAMGGLIALGFRLTGELAVLGPSSLGLLEASLDVNGQTTRLGALPIVQVPPLTGGITATLRAASVRPEAVRLVADLHVPNPAALASFVPDDNGRNAPHVP